MNVSVHISVSVGAVTENTDQGWRSRKEGCRHVPSSHCISWRRRSDEKPRMAQSVRRPEALGAVYLESQRNKSRTSYFCNVKSRSGFLTRRKTSKTVKHFPSHFTYCSESLTRYIRKPLTSNSRSICNKLFMSCFHCWMTIIIWASCGWKQNSLPWNCGSSLDRRLPLLYK